MRQTGKIVELVYTIKERCRVCYTCVRECPAKAIRIYNGQAEVIHERCIGCGNCIKVCSQGAKVFRTSATELNELLSGSNKVAACVAPSFPAEFSDIDDYKKLVGMLRQMGFTYVNEVAFGADVIARKYKEILEAGQGQGFISSDCPAITYYIRQYYPELAHNLAPLVSPMVATARIIRKIYGNETRIVFIGPCIAKKSESDEIDVAITFRELRDLFKQKQINQDTVCPSEFDPPFAGKGAIFPVSRGLIQTVGIYEDLLDGNLVVAEGRISFQQAIKEYSSGDIKHQHLELLCCEGCIMGPGMSVGGKKYARRSLISQYVNQKLQNHDENTYIKNIEQYLTINLYRDFREIDRRIPKPTAAEIDTVLKSIGKFQPSDHLNCGACGYDTCEEHAIAIIEGLAEVEMCLPYTIEKLHNSVKDLAISNEKLASVQLALKQSEKLAHMGQLSAGIAHELNNPLGVIIMYSNLLLDACPPDSDEQKDLQMIVEQSDRCKKIVGGLLNFARKNQVNYDEVDIVKLCEKSVASIIIPSNIQVKIETNIKYPYISVDADQMIQVFSNLLKNAVDAITGEGLIIIDINESNDEVIVQIKDNGAGIREEHMKKLYEPFFTTKPTGLGTGLGLPIVYGIVKMHKGKIDVVSNADPQKGPTGTTFSIKIPRNNLY